VGRKRVVDVEVDLGLLRRAAAWNRFDSDGGKPKARPERVEKLAGVKRKLWGAGIWAGWGGHGEFLASGLVLDLTRVRKKKGKPVGKQRLGLGFIGKRHAGIWAARAVGGLARGRVERRKEALACRELGKQPAAAESRARQRTEEAGAGGRRRGPM
jgi:hypothetical protein